MNDEMLRKLRRLGVVKGARQLKVPPLKEEQNTEQRQSPTAQPLATSDRPDTPLTIEQCLPGSYLLTNEAGTCLVNDEIFPATHPHGAHLLAELLPFPLTTAVPYIWPDVPEGEWSDFLFLDSETTGLWGVGTLAFMVGVGFFTQTAAGAPVFIVRQYFLRDQADEGAMLLALAELLSQKRGLITFNGRTFDIPLLADRYVLNRLPGHCLAVPHLDLLPPARRLWRRRLGGCALTALEETLLEVNRSQVDVPGWYIPRLYEAYLRDGDARELQRVFYHNRLDILSMVTLATRLLAQLAEVEAAAPALDAFSLARWQWQLALVPEAERNLRRAAAAADLELTHLHQIWHELALLLKRTERIEEAVPWWQQIAATSFEAAPAHEELAKYHEWHTGDIAAAAQWTRSALRLGAPAGVTDDLRYRLARLERKLA